MSDTVKIEMPGWMWLLFLIHTGLVALVALILLIGGDL